MKQAILGWSLVLVLVGCSNDLPSGGGGSGGVGAQGGAASDSSGGVPSTGGSTATAGDTAAGGSSVGGVLESGGAGATAGVASRGGAIGGTTSGGVVGSGGASRIGGSASRGGAIGGTSSGGAVGSGGASRTGGSASRGGATGGTSGGGAVGSGGASRTGGSASRGGATGGTSGGGAMRSGGAAGGTTGTVPNGSVPTIAGCNIFPADNPWNLDISAYPLNANSATYLANMSPATGFHPDWGTVTDEYGIPFSTGTGATPQPLTWNVDWGSSESDQLACPTGTNKFCYPIPLTASVEGGPSAASDSDRHVLYIDTAGAPNNCTLYELYNAQNPTGGSGWTASNGAIFHLGSNTLRTDGWTSSDAAGLPVLPGLVRYEDVMAGEIRHAIRFTVSRSQQGYIHPATHAAGNSSTTLPPMGLRLRLKASFATSSFSGPTLVILTAMKKYGIILADNGSNWYISGETHEGWASYMDDLVSGLRQVHGSDFEVVDTGPVSTAGL